MTAREIFRNTLEELGFANYKQSEMTNSDNWLCTCTAMERYADYKLQQYKEMIAKGEIEE